MRRSRSRLSQVGWLLGLSGAVLACGSGARNDGATHAGGASVGGGGGSVSAGGSSTGASSGMTLELGGDTSPDPLPTGHCSGDLRMIVDESGNSISSCADDEGCSGGVCVSACQAAASSTGSIGCEFWAPDPAFFQNGRGTAEDGPCFAVFLANAWSRPAKLTVTRAGRSLDVASFARIPRGLAPNTHYDPIPADGVPANGVAVLFLSHKPGSSNADTSLECPVTPALLEDAAIQGPGKGSAFHIVTDTPVSAYDIVPYGGASSYLPSATLLLPAASWGTNYVAIAPRNDQTGSLWSLIVASEDHTQVKVAPRESLPGSASLASAPAGQVTTYSLNAGESIQWLDANFKPTIDPSGTIFQSDKPIGLWTGNTFLNVASATSPGGGFNDAAHQQIPHVKALGHEYVGAGVVTRLPSGDPESVPYRVMGVVDGTKLTWDPSPLNGAPATLGAGEIAEFETTQVFSVSSQDSEHPFAFTQYMPGTPRTPAGTVPGCSVAPSRASTCGLGDEDWVHLVSPQQFLQHYVFFTDPTYATTNLVLIRSKGERGFSDVAVECLGKIEHWLPVGSAGKYQVAGADLVRGSVPLGTCTGSRQAASSAGAFGIVVWGTDLASSYGYPAGGNLASINQVVVPPVLK